MGVRHWKTFKVVIPTTCRLPLGRRQAVGDILALFSKSAAHPTSNYNQLQRIGALPFCTSRSKMFQDGHLKPHTFLFICLDTFMGLSYLPTKRSL